MPTGPSQGRIAHAGTLELGFREQPCNVLKFERVFRSKLRTGFWQTAWRRGWPLW
jgi:hypothetical protein